MEDWYSIISTALAVASIVFGYYWYRKAKQEILPRYTSSSDLIIDSFDAEPLGSIELAVDDVPVAQLSKCVLYFWNAGKLTLKGSDIIGSISLELPGDVIGQVKATANRDVCKPHTSVSGSRIDLSFSFLDYGDVIMVSALYDGPKADPQLQATIMGVPEGVKKTGWTYWDSDDSETEHEEDVEVEPAASKTGILARAALFLLALEALLTKPLWDSYIPYHPPFLDGIVAYWILAALAGIAFVFLLSSLLRRIPEKYWMALLSVIFRQWVQKLSTKSWIRTLNACHPINPIAPSPKGGARRFQQQLRHLTRSHTRTIGDHARTPSRGVPQADRPADRGTPRRRAKDRIKFVHDHQDNGPSQEQLHAPNLHSPPRACLL